MNNKTRIFSTIFSLGVMLFSFNHCVLDQKVNTKNTGTTNTSEVADTSNNNNNNNNNGGNNSTPTPTPTATPIVDDPSPPPIVVQSAEIDVGVKNFEQINETMSVLTGVSAGTNAVRNVYNDLEVQLPTDNSIKSFLSANQVAITKLAAEYCHALVESGTLRGNVWPGFNFGGTPNAVLTNNTQKIQFIDQTLNSFWGMNVGGDRTASQLELLSLMNELLQGENLGSNTTTRTTAKGICTAALSSAQVTLM